MPLGATLPSQFTRSSRAPFPKMEARHRVGVTPAAGGLRQIGAAGAQHWLAQRALASGVVPPFFTVQQRRHRDFGLAGVLGHVRGVEHCASLVRPKQVRLQRSVTGVQPLVQRAPKSRHR